MSAQESQIVQLFLLFRAKLRNAVQGCDFAVQQIFFGIEAENLRQRRVDFGYAVIRGRQVHALAQGLKKFRETRFAFAFLGDVARKTADSVNSIVAYDGVQNAIKITKRSRLLHARAHHARPAPPLNESRQPLFKRSTVTGFGKIKKFGDGAAHDIRERQAEQVGKTPVDGKNFSVVGNGKQKVFKGIDQVAIALLGSGNEGKKLIELLGIVSRAR